VIRLVEIDGCHMVKCGLQPPVGPDHWHALLDITCACGGSERLNLSVLDADFHKDEAHAFSRAIARTLRRWADMIDRCPGIGLGDGHYSGCAFGDGVATADTPNDCPTCNGTGTART
jgi:hypothetical protein